MMKMYIFFFFLSICTNITCHVAPVNTRRMEIYSINIPYVMIMPMGSILAITLMNSQQTVPCVNINATARGWTFLTTKLALQTYIHPCQSVVSTIMSKTGKCTTTSDNGHTERFSGIQRKNIDLPLRDYLCIISVCRSSLPVPPSPSSD